MADAATIALRLEETETAIHAMVTSPKPSYRIGEQEVDWQKYLDWLLKLKAMYEADLLALEEPGEVVTHLVMPGDLYRYPYGT